MAGSSKDQSHVVASTTELTMVTLGVQYIERVTYYYCTQYRPATSHTVAGVGTVPRACGMREEPSVSPRSPRSPHSEPSEPSEPSKPSVGDLGALGALGALGERRVCLASGMLGNLTEDSHAACLLPAGKGCGISPLLQLLSS